MKQQLVVVTGMDSPVNHRGPNLQACRHLVDLVRIHRPAGCS